LIRFFLCKGDFDELIVPKRSKNLIELIDLLDKTYPKASHFKFPSTNFYSFLPDTNVNVHDKDNAISKLNSKLKNNIIQDLMILRKFNRTMPFSYQRGTKCIIKPDRVSEAGIHDALPLNNIYQPVEVPFSIGAVHHYRDDFIDFRIKENTSIIDNTMLNFIDTLLKSKFYKIIKAKMII
jgi:hypothetical protein